MSHAPDPSGETNELPGEAQMGLRAGRWCMLGRWDQWTSNFEIEDATAKREMQSDN